MAVAAPISAIASVPPGRWGIGVSGGADSVALLRLLHGREELSLHVIHLDHQTREGESARDASFVADLCMQHGVTCTIARRSDVEATMTDLPANVSSRYRMARLALFRQVVADHKLMGVLLAHHADDLAETVLLRLLRGSGPPGIGGMEKQSQLGDLLLLRPLLAVSGKALRDYLETLAQPWREDSSNASDAYLRNRLRPFLRRNAALADDLRELGNACQSLRDWTRSAASDLPAAFAVEAIADSPSILAVESARRWLIDRGVPPEQISPAITARLVAMARDAATAPKELFPGRVQARRKKGIIQIDRR